MSKLVSLIVAAAVLVASFGLVGFLFNSPAITLALIVASALAGVLGCAWYYADDEPVMGPDTPERVTFFKLLQRIFRGIGAITRPIWIRVWLNLPFGAVIAVDGVAMLTPELREAIFGNVYGALALVALNLVARYGSTPAHAPVPSAR